MSIAASRPYLPIRSSNPSQRIQFGMQQQSPNIAQADNAAPPAGRCIDRPREFVQAHPRNITRSLFRGGPI